MSCEYCKTSKAVIVRPKNKHKLCKTCFFDCFENDIHKNITESNMFSAGERVAIGMSGGKDSTVLAYVLNMLNKKHQYGLDLVLLSIDEGISGYRDHSLKTVQQNQCDLELELMVLSFEEIFGFSMDKIVKKMGNKNNCSSCGTFRRRSLEIGAKKLGADCIVTGHNADDISETVLLNLFRGDVNRLKVCTFSRTLGSGIPRCKPFKFIFQKEIVMYAFHKKLKYFSTECTYSPGAFRGDMRLYIKNLENIDPLYILNLIKSGDSFWEYDKESSRKQANFCKVCRDSLTLSNKNVCKACLLVTQLDSL